MWGVISKKKARQRDPYKAEKKFTPDGSDKTIIRCKKVREREKSAYYVDSIVLHI